jgi:alginate O-acetyltransferase complex protein AlgI
MIFNSLDFAIFLPIVFALYWLIGRRNIKQQNLLLIVASYFFYGLWDWRFLSLIAISTILDYIISRKIENSISNSNRKILLGISVSVNIGILLFFKYYNFFIDSFIDTFSFFGKDLNISSLEIVLPVGISFYTFQTLSFTIDVYRRKIASSKDLISFAAFVCFFPQLVAGPIERATNLLPQFSVKRNFDYSKAVDGLKQILWGLFKKVVIADNCAKYANIIFNDYAEYQGSTLVLGAFFFSVQIYCDFSGYSDIAIGTSRLFGFNLKQNFAFPYFSRNISEFWRKWHISLSTWFRDYLYIPIGGSKGGKWNKVRNTFVIFIVSGFWHGANWTFVTWGFANALLFLPYLLTNTNRNHLKVVAEHSFFPSLKEFFQIVFTFILVSLTWVFFRSESMGHAINYFSGMFSLSLFTNPNTVAISGAMTTLKLILVFFSIEWLGRRNLYGIEKLMSNWKSPFRYLLYYLLIFSIFYFSGEDQEFIYFQF